MLKAIIVAKVLKLVRTHGMKYVLMALIEITNSSDMRQLNADLRLTLKNYEERNK
jgi:hypothetical protein